MSSKRDYYEVLGVGRESSGDELRKAYKREALKFHPDRNPGDPTAEAKFKEVNEAYQVLGDEQKRHVYDQFGHAGLDGSAGGFDGGIGAHRDPTPRRHPVAGDLGVVGERGMDLERERREP